METQSIERKLDLPKRAFALVLAGGRGSRLMQLTDRRAKPVELLVSGGGSISGEVVRSVLFSSVRVHSWSRVEWSVLLPEVEIGRRVRLHRAVVDRGCQIPDGMVIGEDPQRDAQRFFRTDNGVTLVTKAMLAALGFGRWLRLLSP